MARKKRRTLNKNKKGHGKAGSRWGHNFTPKNAVARKLKNKTYGRKGIKSKRRRK